MPIQDPIRTQVLAQHRKRRNAYLLGGAFLVAGIAIFVMLMRIFFLSNVLETDGVRINMMGRQRMLSQRMAKEALLAERGLLPAVRVRSTMDLFERSQHALAAGGRVQKGLGDEPEGYYHLSGETHLGSRESLGRLMREWLAFRDLLDRFLATRDQAVRDELLKRNELLLHQLDAAVTVVQNDMAATRLHIILYIGLLSVLVLGILVFSFIFLYFDLRRARSRIDTLEQLLPICSNCKKIRMEGQPEGSENTWMPIEHYLMERDSMRFTHGLCPDCAEKLYPEIMAKIRKDQVEGAK